MYICIYVYTYIYIYIYISIIKDVYVPCINAAGQALLDWHGAALGGRRGPGGGADGALLPGLAERTPGATDGAEM